MSRFKYHLQVLFSYNAWFRIGRYSSKWDATLQQALKERIVIEDCFTATIGEHRVWIANHPYGAGCLEGTEVYPSRTTIMELRDLLKKNILVQILDGSLPANFKLRG